jgi:two-component system, LytTR family, response regulator
MKDPLVINQTEIIHVIQQNEILYCKADRSYCYVHLVNGEIITNTRTLSCLSKHLNENFIRISQSLFVNKQHIRKIFKKGKCLELLNGEQLSYTIKSGDLIYILSKPVMHDEMADMQ